MTFKPQVLKSLLDIGQGIARPSLYQVFITPPNFVLNGSLPGGLTFDNFGDLVVMARELPFLSLKAEAINLPGKQLSTTPFIMYGTEQKLPYGVTFDDLNIRFMCTNSMLERKYFDAWHTFITDPMTNYWHYYDNYVATIHIVKLPDDVGIEDAAGVVMEVIAGGGAGDLLSAFGNFYYCKIEEAYPVTIQSQDLSYDADGYLTLNIQFAYRRWRANGDASLGLSNFF